MVSGGGGLFPRVADFGNYPGGDGARAGLRRRQPLRGDQQRGVRGTLFPVWRAGFRVEPKFGYSLYSLACSVVPRVLWPERPRDIYLYYSESVGTIQNQGYSLHHATGWYLNFGYAGVAVGAVVLGLIWAACLNAHQKIRRQSGLLYRLFAIIAPWVLVAGLPPLIRAGPEGYKGLILESFLIPIGVLVFACRTKFAKP